MSLSVGGFGLRDVLGVILPGLLVIYLTILTLGITLDLATTLLLGILTGYALIPLTGIYGRFFQLFKRYKDVDQREIDVRSAIDLGKLYGAITVDERNDRSDVNAYSLFYLNGAFYSVVFLVMNVLILLASILLRLNLSSPLRSYGLIFLAVASYVFYRGYIQYRISYIQLTIELAKKYVALVLRHPISAGVVGTIQDRRGFLLSEASVSVTGKTTAGRPFQFNETNKWGVYAIALDPGDYDVEIKHPEYLDFVNHVPIDAGDKVAQLCARLDPAK